ncbi:hypothetical protein AAHB37_17735 [Glutamicibacter halophytocola]|uniref:hypothetical protein n=1 Tax=Glutamicibacter halophytocola TaxID=1933880 RepID=UPI0032197664
MLRGSREAVHGPEVVGIVFQRHSAVLDQRRLAAVHDAGIPRQGSVAITHREPV